ncbi:MAG: anaerobic ribonucleoside-triphosphate reductase activating protein [Candidatus Aenigmatarchaeota archaeon]
MKIGGLQKFTVTDYPGKVACIVFTTGCNFRCPFCHNRQLVLEGAEGMPEEKVLNFLGERKGKLDGVVVTGGEPTIQSDLVDFLEKVKELGYSVKLDTNGSIPEALEEVIEKNLVDYIAMDVKAPLDGYDKAGGVDVKTEKIKESIELIMDGMENYEFRTTAVPGLIDEEAVESIARTIEGAERFFLQQFEPKNTLDEKYEGIDKLPIEKLEKFKQIAGKYVKSCELRNV